MSAVVVLPTYNEHENLLDIAEAILARPADVDLLIVDDGSPDGTADLARELVAKHPDRVELMARTAKEGLGRAYVAAFNQILAAGKHDVLIQMDADFSHDPADLDRLVAEIDHADVVIGSRYCHGGGVSGWSKHREVLSRGGNTYARILLGSQLHDLTGGFRAWRADLLRKIDPTTATSDGYAFQIEMAARAAGVGARILEIPITFHERAAGVSKMSPRIAVEAFLGVPEMRRRVRKDLRS